MVKKHTVKNLFKKYEDNNYDAQQLLKSVLLKKARGFVLEEISEEYSTDESDKMKLVKRKITSKEVAPDISAVKALAELNMFHDDVYKEMSYEDLQKEKNRLLQLLSEEENYEN